MEAYASYALLAVATPFCLWATWTDLKYMLIPNILVIIMAAAFMIIAPIFLPFDVYLWRILAGAIVLTVGFILFSIGGLGGGDAKFAAAMIMFVDQTMFIPFLLTFALFTLLAVILHKLIKFLPFARPITSSWESWTNRKKFPLGFGMGGALITFLAQQAFA
ncbi:MAG: prepilin peptidase [Paracoccaceae bacterium]